MVVVANRQNARQRLAFALVNLQIRLNNADETFFVLVHLRPGADLLVADAFFFLIRTLTNAGIFFDDRPVIAKRHKLANGHIGALG